jgi:acetyl esterase/lipase
MKRVIAVALVLLLAAGPALAENLEVAHKELVYGRKHGMALTLSVYTPKKNANGLGVIYVVSGGWVSDPAMLPPAFFTPFLQRGYTVFAVGHGSMPRFTIPEIIQDMNRSVRFIRHTAKEHGVDPDRLGIAGGSAGGHLSLMIGTAGADGDEKAKDPVDRESSRVQAVACFFPPTDFLNYGEKEKLALGVGVLEPFKAAFEFTEFNKTTKTYVPIHDVDKVLAIGKQISPITHVSADDPPTLIIHGDKDKLVPYQQAEIMVAKLKEAGVTAELVTKKDAEHGWPTLAKEDVPQLVEWFDKHLKKKDTK